MEEVFPILAGAAIGLLVQRIASARARIFALVALSALVGFAASLISGELLVSWNFVLFDIPQVFVAAVVTIVGMDWLRRRAPRA